MPGSEQPPRAATGPVRPRRVLGHGTTHPRPPAPSSPPPSELLLVASEENRCRIWFFPS